MVALLGSASRSRAETDLSAGQIKIEGGYGKLDLMEGKKSKKFAVIEPAQAFKLRAGGPASVVILVRAQGKDASVTLEVFMDETQTAKVDLTVNERRSKGLFIDIPAGTHAFSMTASRKIMTTPIRLKRRPVPGETLVVWEPRKQEANTPPAQIATLVPEAQPSKSTPPPVSAATPKPLEASAQPSKVHDGIILILTNVAEDRAALTNSAERLMQQSESLAWLRWRPMAEVEQQILLARDTEGMAECLADVNCAMGLFKQSNSSVAVALGLVCQQANCYTAVRVMSCFSDKMDSIFKNIAGSREEGLQKLPQLAIDNLALLYQRDVQ